MRMQTVLSLSLAGILAFSTVGKANSTATASAPSVGGSATQSSTSELLRKIRSKTRANYVFEMYGMNTEALSGNVAGGGTNLTINHYFGLGYKIGSKWSVMATQPFKQVIDEKPSSVVDPFSASDPYLTFSNSSILKSAPNNFNLSGYIRWYAPTSRLSQQRVDAASRVETGYGLLRAALTPSFSWMDGALSFNFYNFFYYRLAKNSSQERFLKTGNPNRDDFYYIMDPILSYTLNKTFSVYLEYGAVLRHNTEGKWTNLKKEHYVATGLYINATPKLFLMPYISARPEARGFRSMDMGLIASYTLL